MKIAIFTFLMVFVFTFLQAQEVVSTAGETNTAGNLEVSWTVGEPVISTFSTDNSVLTQGFHQTKLIITAISDIVDSNIKIKVYPNPTEEFVVVQFNEIIQNSSFLLLNMNGSELESGMMDAVQKQINLSGYASGTYLLHILKNNGERLQTFKIQKK